MALKECWECGGPVARSASKCPHCGVKSPGSRTTAGINGCALICLIAGGVLTLFITVPALCSIMG